MKTLMLQMDNDVYAFYEFISKIVERPVEEILHDTLIKNCEFITRYVCGLDDE